MHGAVNTYLFAVANISPQALWLWILWNVKYANDVVVFVLVAYAPNLSFVRVCLCN